MGTFATIGSALWGHYAQNRALEAQARANVQTARNMIQSMNYNLQNREMERKDLFEATVQELEKIEFQGRRLSSSVEAAVNEGLGGGGRTATMISRAAEADTERNKIALKSNYKKKSNEIDLGKEAAVLNARQQIGGIQDIKKPSLLNLAATIGTAYYQGLQQQDALRKIRISGNVPTKQSTFGLSPIQQYQSTFDLPFGKSYDTTYKNLLGDIRWDKPKFTFDNLTRKNQF